MHQTISADTIGHTLRRARELASMRERTAARTLGIRRSRLREWESGAAVPDADELARAVELYSADLRQIWPDRQPLVTPDEPGVLVVGDERIDVLAGPTITAADPADLDNRVVLPRYIAAVRRQRGLTPTDPVELRATDIASLSVVLDLHDELLEAELMELLDLTPAGARWTTRAIVVGGLIAVGGSTLVGSSWFSPAGAATVDRPTPVTAETLAPPLESFPPEVSEQTRVQFAPDVVDPDAPVEAQIVSTNSEAPGSPFTTEPSAPRAELATAVFAVAPATEWSPVVEDPAGELLPVDADA